MISSLVRYPVVPCGRLRSSDANPIKGRASPVPNWGGAPSSSAYSLPWGPRSCRCPATLVGSLSLGTLQGFVYAAELVAITAVTVPVLFAQWRRLRSDAFTGERYANPVIVRYSLVYLAVMAVLWLTALPAYFSAVDGITPNGDPTGSLWYATVCSSWPGYAPQRLPPPRRGPPDKRMPCRQKPPICGE
jgi:hypothetical protein